MGNQPIAATNVVNIVRLMSTTKRRPPQQQKSKTTNTLSILLELHGPCSKRCSIKGSTHPTEIAKPAVAMGKRNSCFVVDLRGKSNSTKMKPLAPAAGLGIGAQRHPEAQAGLPPPMRELEPSKVPEGRPLLVQNERHPSS